MKKSFAIIFTALFAFISASAFADEPQCYNITDSDIKNFVKYFKQIDYASKDLEDDLEFDNNATIPEIIELFTAAEGLEPILTQYGISGPNATAKFVTILFGALIVTTEYTLENSPDVQKSLQDNNITIEEFLNQILGSYYVQLNSKDLEVLRRNREEILKFADAYYKGLD